MNIIRKEKEYAVLKAEYNPRCESWYVHCSKEDGRVPTGYCVAHSCPCWKRYEGAGRLWTIPVDPDTGKPNNVRCAHPSLLKDEEEVKEEERTGKIKKIKPKYSGKLSESFWDIINSLPEEKQDAAYALGCVLQNIEADILRQINLLIEGEARK